MSVPLGHTIAIFTQPITIHLVPFALFALLDIIMVKFIVPVSNTTFLSNQKLRGGLFMWLH